jgi:hypothetical protein
MLLELLNRHAQLLSKYSYLFFSFLKHTFFSQDRATVRFVHSFENSNYLGSDSSLLNISLINLLY